MWKWRPVLWRAAGSVSVCLIEKDEEWSRSLAEGNVGSPYVTSPHLSISPAESWAELTAGVSFLHAAIKGSSSELSVPDVSSTCSHVLLPSTLTQSSALIFLLFPAQETHPNSPKLQEMLLVFYLCDEVITAQLSQLIRPLQTCVGS